MRNQFSPNFRTGNIYANIFTDHKLKHNTLTSFGRHFCVLRGSNVASVGSVFNDARKVKVLSLPETIKEKSTFRAKALRRRKSSRAEHISFIDFYKLAGNWLENFLCNTIALLRKYFPATTNTFLSRIFFAGLSPGPSPGYAVCP